MRPAGKFSLVCVSLQAMKVLQLFFFFPSASGVVEEPSVLRKGHRSRADAYKHGGSRWGVGGSARRTRSKLLCKDGRTKKKKQFRSKSRLKKCCRCSRSRAGLKKLFAEFREAPGASRWTLICQFEPYQRSDKL